MNHRSISERWNDTDSLSPKVLLIFPRNWWEYKQDKKARVNSFAVQSHTRTMIMRMIMRMILPVMAYTRKIQFLITIIEMKINHLIDI